MTWNHPDDVPTSLTRRAYALRGIQISQNDYAAVVADAYEDVRRDILKEQPVTAAQFRERLVQNLSAEAHACDGPPDCEMTEQECWDAHPLIWTATLGGTVHLDGSTEAIADVVVRVAQELGILPLT